MIEQSLKILIGEYVIQICVLQEQLKQANEKIAELTAVKETNGSDNTK